MKNWAFEAAKIAARIADARRKGDLYLPGGDEQAKAWAVQELKEQGHETLTEEEIAQMRKRHSRRTKK